MASLAIIPARAGSKGVPRKNWRDFHGRPLVAWTIEQALETCDRVIVSTDAPQVMGIALDMGAEFVERPAELCTDDASVTDAERHVLEQLDGDPEILVRLQPTSPLRSNDDVSVCLARVQNGARSVVAVSSVRQHPWLVVGRDNYGRMSGLSENFRSPRQSYPPRWWINGAIYACTMEHWRDWDGFFSPYTMMYEMPLVRGWDIDTEEDWEICSLLMRSSLASQRA